MRRIVVAMMVAMAAGSAQAADLPDLTDLPILRGGFRDGLSTGTRNWRGFYVGGQIGHTAAGLDFSQAPSSMTGFMLRNSVLQEPVSSWTVLSKEDVSTTGFGGFVGRNYQWDDAVLGFEASYNHYRALQGSSSGGLSRRLLNPGGTQPPAGHTDVYDATVGSSADIQIKDVLTLRARAGWSAGNFMPYAFGGLAIGRVASSRSVSLSSDRYDFYDGVDPFGNPIHTETFVSSLSLSDQEGRKNNFVAGYTLGLGTEMALFGNLFARAEWEYVKFLKVKDISVSMNTIRAGIGYRF